ncbi:MAG: FadR/GntR family transcriptional regulator [Chloroflexota bacterium]
MLKSLKGHALTEAIRAYVKQYILDHNLNAGDPLPPEIQLAESLGVGRSSVREAIKALQSLGIVEVQHGNGLFVRAPNVDPILETLSHNLRFDPTMFAEVFQIRVWLESAVIEDAVFRITDTDIDQLGEVLQSWEIRLENNDSVTDLDEKFHRILYQTMNNRTLMNILEVFWRTLKQLDREVQNKTDLWVSYQEHQAILASVQAKDAQKTRQKLIDHFGYVKAWISKQADRDIDADRKG